MLNVFSIWHFMLRKSNLTAELNLFLACKLCIWKASTCCQFYQQKLQPSSWTVSDQVICSFLLTWASSVDLDGIVTWAAVALSYLSWLLLRLLPLPLKGCDESPGLQCDCKTSVIELSWVNYSWKGFNFLQLMWSSSDKCNNILGRILLSIWALFIYSLYYYWY